MQKYGEMALIIVKYLLVGVTFFGGITTMFSPVTPAAGALGLIYSSRITLIILGVIIMGCALALLYGRLRRSRVWTGRGLMAVYCCYFFAALLNGAAFGWTPDAWLPNMLLAFIAGILWLRWKFKTEYIDPQHFKDAVELRYNSDN